MLGTWLARTYRVALHGGRARRFIGSAFLLVSAMSACVVPPPYYPAPVTGGLTLRDSAAIAYETGRRDATMVHRPRTAVMVMSLAFPVGLIAARSTNEFWAAPIAVSALAGAGTLWSYNETQRPLPVAPDSMRSRYGLDDVFMWGRYQRGFQDAVEDQRRAELERSSRSTLMVVLVFGLTYVATRPRRH